MLSDYFCRPFVSRYVQSAVALRSESTSPLGRRGGSAGPVAGVLIATMNSYPTTSLRGPEFDHRKLRQFWTEKF